MFQRLKGISDSLNSRIAEEQARQKAAASTPPISRTSSTRRSTSSRTESPASRPKKPKHKEDANAPRGPDPSEFENAFVLADEPQDVAESKKAPAEGETAVTMADTTADPDESKEKETAEPASPPKAIELPPEVRTKLRKLEKLEAKYQELLRSYRVAHARAISIEPFEKQLKEHTPLSTISDPGALVEYLNQVNLKGDMVMDELKRVSTDRDNYRKKFEEAEQQVSKTSEELAKLRTVHIVDSTVKAETRSLDGTSTASVKSPAASVLKLVSPKQIGESADSKDSTEDFFSYDDELPQLQNEMKEKIAEVEELKARVVTLEADLISAQETSTKLVENLEKATRDLSDAKESANAGQSRQEEISTHLKEIQSLRDKLEATECRITTLEADLANKTDTAQEQIVVLTKDLGVEKDKASTYLTELEHIKTECLTLTENLKEEQLKSQSLEAEIASATERMRKQEPLEDVKMADKQVNETSTQNTDEGHTKSSASLEALAAGPNGAAKKKNKKKKKGPSAAISVPKDGALEKGSSSVPGTPVTGDLHAQLSKLKEELAERDAQIVKLQSKRKTEEELREKIEEMEDNLLMIGNEHVEAKDQIKELQKQKLDLESRIKELEQELDRTRSSSKVTEAVEADLSKLTKEYEALRSKSATLQTDLGAAQQLATSRYRDLTDLRDVLQKAQPELKTLRAENASLKTVKEELTARTSDLRRLEGREKDLKADMASFKKQAADSQTEIRNLTEKVTQESNARVKAEDGQRVAQRDMRKSEAEKIQLAAAGEKSATELAKVQEEATKLHSQVRELEAQVDKFGSESKGLRDEVELRGTQYNTAQGLLGSMRDQAGEMAMQLKEAQSQSESLEEELAEVQRLLSERTREGETMRRLLADVDDRADAKVREMRERMEAAIEERDRAEDEASTNGRRRAREADELKNRIRDMERDLKVAQREKEELEHSEKEWRRKREELETTASTSSKEVSEIRSAMNELRDALDGSEKSVRDAEKQRSDLRKLLDEANQRYEKVSKEVKALRLRLSEGTSSRSSLDSGRGGGVNSKGINGAVASAAASGGTDYVYLKTILLQFLEQKDRRVQESLVKTVLGSLLHFDKKDQEKWIAAITAK